MGLQAQMREFAQRLRDAAPRPLTLEQILAWGDAHHERTGDWPKVKSGPLVDAAQETWSGINAALEVGLADWQVVHPWPACFLKLVVSAIIMLSRI